MSCSAHKGRYRLPVFELTDENPPLSSTLHEINAFRQSVLVVIAQKSMVCSGFYIVLCIFFSACIF